LIIQQVIHVLLAFAVVVPVAPPSRTLIRHLLGPLVWVRPLGAAAVSAHALVGVEALKAAIVRLGESGQLYVEVAVQHAPERRRFVTPGS
jgi:hypothetical protein